MKKSIMKGLIEKNLKVRKAPRVQGAVKIHFPNPKITDITLTNFAPVDIFSRIGITEDDIKSSNLEDLVNQRILAIC